MWGCARPIESESHLLSAVYPDEYLGVPRSTEKGIENGQSICSCWTCVWGARRKPPPKKRPRMCKGVAAFSDRAAHEFERSHQAIKREEGKRQFRAATGAPLPCQNRRYNADSLSPPRICCFLWHAACGESARQFASGWRKERHMISTRILGGRTAVPFPLFPYS